MKIGLAVRELHRSERKLARELDAVAARHRTDHEVFHVARDIAGWSRDHIDRLAVAGRRFDIDLRERPRTESVTAALQSRLAVAVRRRPEPALLLLADLRRVHRTAAGVSLDWELLAQAAQAIDDSELLALCTRCHPETLRQVRWANAMLKVLSPQALAS
ncbi:hypothetical protein [Rhodococcus sp. (in: high G+C Gram-positive bacteria)]|uniref:hypothetical protein n=1 Tax=Rhodococcus sp. TaxID=1831 RepID=UPI003B8A86BB